MASNEGYGVWQIYFRYSRYLEFGAAGIGDESAGLEERTARLEKMNDAVDWRSKVDQVRIADPSVVEAVFDRVNDSSIECPSWAPLSTTGSNAAVEAGSTQCKSE